jgi:hypothetical protein
MAESTKSELAKSLDLCTSRKKVVMLTAMAAMIAVRIHSDGRRMHHKSPMEGNPSQALEQKARKAKTQTFHEIFRLGIVFEGRILF